MMLLSVIKPMVETIFNIPTLLALKKKSNTRRVFLMMTPQYVNYGDHGIAEAELRFLHENFPELSVVEISLNVLEQWYEFVEKAIGPNDVIAITGGGFLGDLWPSLQKMVLKLLESFPQNTMVLFPQTIWFSQHSELLERTKIAFSHQTKLLVFLRDERSYQFACKELMHERKEYCKYVPDMVLYAQYFPSKCVRKKVAFCLRADTEQTISPEMRECCQKYLKGKNVPWYEISMATQHAEFPIWLRKFFLLRKFNEYRQCRLVITDRLHGMLFAAITGTPCLAFDNISKKVSGVHAWICNDSNVRLYNEDMILTEQLDILLKQERNCHDWARKNLFDDMISSLGGFLNDL